MTIPFDAAERRGVAPHRTPPAPGAADPLHRALTENGYADMGRVLLPDVCAMFADMYGDDALFRSRIDMRRYSFGAGEYKYFAYPLPGTLTLIREQLYDRLAPVANAWEDALGTGRRFPARHADFREECRLAGQTRPTPLLLTYGAGDYNCLHQDLYGDLSFPIQVVILLSHPSDFDGGEFVLTEQRPRMQSRAEVVPLLQGHALAFAVNDRPKAGTRGPYRIKQRHGVSRVRRGTRRTLGVIFHDAPDPRSKR